VLTDTHRERIMECVESMLGLWYTVSVVIGLMIVALVPLWCFLVFGYFLIWRVL
jgi:hypothetical protein